MFLWLPRDPSFMHAAFYEGSASSASGAAAAVNERASEWCVAAWTNMRATESLFSLSSCFFLAAHGVFLAICFVLYLSRR